MSQDREEHEQGQSLQRHRPSRSITYSCIRCGACITENRYPSPLPRYCPPCKQEREQERIATRRDAARERMRRLRDRRRQEDRHRDDRWPAVF